MFNRCDLAHKINLPMKLKLQRDAARDIDMALLKSFKAENVNCDFISPVRKFRYPKLAVRVSFPLDLRFDLLIQNRNPSLGNRRATAVNYCQCYSRRSRLDLE